MSNDSYHKHVSTALLNQSLLIESLKKKRNRIEKIAKDGPHSDDNDLIIAICSVLTAGYYLDDHLKKNPQVFFSEN